MDGDHPLSIGIGIELIHGHRWIIQQYSQMEGSNFDSNKNYLQLEIEKEIKHRKFYEKLDLRLAHIFLWVSILASFGSSIIIAADVDIGKLVVAIIAGVPGLVVLIDKSFD